MRDLVSAAALALLVVASVGAPTNAKSKAPAGQEPLAQAVPLLVVLSAAGGTLTADADGTAELVLSGLDDVALRVSRSEAIPMPLGTLALDFGPLFGGDPASAVLTLAPGDPSSTPTRVALELGTPVLDQETHTMTFPASLPAWSPGHPSALPVVEPDVPVVGAVDLGPVSLAVGGTSTRSAIVGPLEILAAPAADGRSVGLVVVGGNGALIAASQLTPDAPYLGFSGVLSDGSNVEGAMEATFTGRGGRIIVHNVEVGGTQPAESKGLLATW